MVRLEFLNAIDLHLKMHVYWVHLKSCRNKDGIILANVAGTPAAVAPLSESFF
jgi:hypothetical protein